MKKEKKWCTVRERIRWRRKERRWKSSKEKRWKERERESVWVREKERGYYRKKDKSTKEKMKTWKEARKEWKGDKEQERKKDDKQKFKCWKIKKLSQKERTNFHYWLIFLRYLSSDCLLSSPHYTCCFEASGFLFVLLRHLSSDRLPLINNITIDIIYLYFIFFYVLFHICYQLNIF